MVTGRPILAAVVRLAASLVVLDSDAAFAQTTPSAEVSCKEYVLSISGSTPPLFFQQGDYSFENRLAYDFLARTDPRPEWDDLTFGTVAAQFADAFSQLKKNYSLALEYPSIDFEYRTLSVALRQDLLYEIRSLSPAAQRARRGISLGFERFEQILRELCIEWIVVDPLRRSPRVQLLLGPLTNPLHAIRELRTIPEIDAVGVASWPADEISKWKGVIRTNIARNTVYFAMTPPREPLEFSGTQYFAVSPTGAKRLDESQVREDPSFRFPEWPADSRLAPIERGYGGGLSNTLVIQNDSVCPECDDWDEARSGPCPLCRGCPIPSMGDIASKVGRISEKDRLLRKCAPVPRRSPEGLIPVPRQIFEFTPVVRAPHRVETKELNCACLPGRLECQYASREAAFDTNPDDYAELGAFSEEEFDAEVVNRVLRAYATGNVIFANPVDEAFLGHKQIGRIERARSGSIDLWLRDGSCSNDTLRLTVTMHATHDDARLTVTDYRNVKETPDKEMLRAAQQKTHRR